MVRWIVRWAALLLLAGGGAALLLAWPTEAKESGPQKAASLYGYPYPDALDCAEGTTDRRNCTVDEWGFTEGQCTSWVAFRLNKLFGLGFARRYKGVIWGDAGRWPHAASKAGLKVDDKPSVGAVAYWPARWDDDPGHVAFVEQVLSPNAIVVTELNADGHNEFRSSTVARGEPGWPTGFIHIAPMNAEPAPTPAGELTEI